MNWKQLISRRRLGATGVTTRPGRPDWQRDGEKAQFAPPLRRLGGKTQVHLSRHNAVRNRLTHSQEVARVGRSLGARLGHDLMREGLLPDDVHYQDIGDIVEAAGLVHDIGTLPWSHAGERAVQDFFANDPLGQDLIAPLSQDERLDFLRMEGNAAGFRLLTRGPSGRVEDGLGMTLTTLAAVIKYPCTSQVAADAKADAATSLAHEPDAARRKHNVFLADLPILREIMTSLGVRDHGNCFARHPLVFLTEAADDICYLVVDLEDAYDLGIIDYGTIIDLYGRVLETATDDWRIRHGVSGPMTTSPGGHYQSAVVASMRGWAISLLIHQAHEAFLANHDAILAGTFRQELLDVVPAAGAIRHIKNISRERIFDHPGQVGALMRGHDTIQHLLRTWAMAMLELDAGGRSNTVTRTRYISAMFPQIFGPTVLMERYTRLVAMMDALVAMTDADVQQVARDLGF